MGTPSSAKPERFAEMQADSLWLLNRLRTHGPSPRPHGGSSGASRCSSREPAAGHAHGQARLTGSRSHQHGTGQQPRPLPPLAPPRGGVTEPAAESLAEQRFLTGRKLLISFLSMGHASAVKCVDSAWSEILVLHFLSRSVTRCSVSGAHPPAKTGRRQTVVDPAPRLPGSNSDPQAGVSGGRVGPWTFFAPARQG